MKILILLTLAYLVLLTSIWATRLTPHYVCSDFKTQKEAMKHYQRYLDKDGDGKPCESLL